MNQTERYQLEALMELALSYPKGQSTAQIATRRKIPPAYLSRLLAELARTGCIRSRRGPGGGVTLARPPETISVASIIFLRNLDTSLPPALDRLAHTIDDAVEASTASISVADLARWERQSTNTNDYAI